MSHRGIRVTECCQQFGNRGLVLQLPSAFAASQRASDSGLRSTFSKGFRCCPRRNADKCLECTARTVPSSSWVASSDPQPPPPVSIAARACAAHRRNVAIRIVAKKLQAEAGSEAPKRSRAWPKAEDPGLVRSASAIFSFEPARARFGASSRLCLKSSRRSGWQRSPMGSAGPAAIGHGAAVAGLTEDPG